MSSPLVTLDRLHVFWKIVIRRRLFCLCVILPTIASATYFGMIASDVYISESLLVVRSPERQISSPIGMLMKGAGFSNAHDDAYVVMEFMISREALKSLDANLGVKNKYSEKSIDIFSRFSAWFDFDDSFEGFFKYFKKHVEQQIDSSSSIITIKTRAFNPQLAQHVNEELLRLSEARVNQLNTRGHQDLIVFARQELFEAKQRAEEASILLSAYRNKNGVIDPERQTVIPLQQIAQLQSELLVAKTQLAQLQLLAKENPQIPSQKQTVKILEKEIEKESAKVTGSGSNSLASKAVEFRKLDMNKEFADKMLASAMNNLEQARNMAQRQQLYLERIANPSFPDAALEPRRFRSVLATFLVCLIIWSIFVLFRAGVREHID